MNNTEANEKKKGKNTDSFSPWETSFRVSFADMGSQL